jgi:aminobenzoyl-glutamate utilization protein B
MQNKVLVELVHEAMETVERPRWTEEELEFAEGLNAGLGKGSAGLDKADSSLKSTVDPVSTIEMYSSTDVGDVQHIAPGVTFLTVTSNSEAAGHSWHNTACGGHSIGHKGMLYGAKVMALAAMKIYEEPGIAEAAKKEFEQTMVGQDYVCPMEGIQLPV